MNAIFDAIETSLRLGDEICPAMPAAIDDGGAFDVADEEGAPLAAWCQSRDAVALILKNQCLGVAVLDPERMRADLAPMPCRQDSDASLGAYRLPQDLVDRHAYPERFGRRLHDANP